MRKFFHNLRFRSKIIWIFAITLFCSTVISGISYYRYTSQDIEKNFRVGAEDVMLQMADTLDLRLGVIRQRSQGMLTNHTFVTELSNYLVNPSDVNLIRAMGSAASSLKDLETGESLIHSTYIYTDRYNFDNLLRMRNWDFDYEQSKYYQYYKENPTESIYWFPVQPAEIYQSSDEVIPYVRKFSVVGYQQEQNLVIQLKKTELERLLKGKYAFFDTLLILDQHGNTIVGADDIDVTALLELTREAEDIKQVSSGDYQYQNETYLVTHIGLKENSWQLFGLKSRQSLLGSLKNLRNAIFEMMMIVFVLGVLAILLFSRQLTHSLQRLEERMRFVRNGDFDVRFFYPYKDEIGSLARGFNYMIEEIQHLIQKQEETIEELKRERDYAATIQMQKRKAELKALQAQINPHFLYNTLNAITWQAADQGAEEISVLSNSLGRFFRISLSKGAEIISLREELEHVTSYLEIQSIRYQSKLNYEIDAGPEWMDCRVIKLILQPLAENSIYHGIKEKEGSGLIVITVKQETDRGEPVLKLIVWDNGKGIPPGKLASLNKSLSDGESHSSEGYGIFNVNERIRLFYGEQYGLQYESVHGEWTRAVLTVPAGDWEVDDVPDYDC